MGRKPYRENRSRKPCLKQEETRQIVLVPKNKNQGLYMSALKEHDQVVVLGPAGTGKAQPLSSKILTPTGWKLMGDMAIGDEVVTQDGTTTKISGVYPQGNKDIYKVTFTDGRSTECCIDHLWKVYNIDWGDKTRIIDTQEIIRLLTLKSKSKRLYIPLYEPKDSQETDFLIDPYVMGSLLGDGHLGDHSILFSSADAESIEKVNRLLPSDYSLTKRGGYDYGLTKKVRNSNINIVLNELRDLGLSGVKSNNKFIPKAYLNSCKQQRMKLLQGLMDTDGTIDNRNSISFTTVSEKLCDDVCYLVRSLGGITKVSSRYTNYTYKNDYKQGQLSYTIRVQIRNPEDIFSLTRKVNKIKGKTLQYKRDKVGIKKVEFIRVDKAQCISVEHESHLYVTDDFIVTHNTFIAASYAAILLEDKTIKKLILTRPNVSSGKSIGFFPGTLEEKMAPWLGPVVNVLIKHLGPKKVADYIEDKTIEVIPFETMRGQSFENSFVILDEAQNTTPHEMKMFLTRIGDNSKVVMNGDIGQSDLPSDSGLLTSLNMIKKYDIPVPVIEFGVDDIVRSKLCKMWIESFIKEEKRES